MGLRVAGFGGRRPARLLPSTRPTAASRCAGAAWLRRPAACGVVSQAVRTAPHRTAPAPLPTQLRAAEDEQGHKTYFQENPRLPYRGAKIMSSQPQFLRDFATGLNTTAFK